MKFVLLASTIAAAAASGSYLWTGMDHAWQREITPLFNTPHRIGTLRNWVEGDGSSGTAHFTFTPGVDGDFAYPEARYTSLTSDDVSFEAFTTTIRMTDLIDTDTNKASVSGSASVSPSWSADHDYAALVLNGVEIDMACVPDAGTCNSNGIWPYFLQLGVDPSCTGLISDSPDSCDVSTTISRAWTPSHGGGKALSTEMEYNVTFHMLGISGSAENFASVVDDEDTIASDIFSGRKTSSRTVTVDKPLSQGAVGLLGFSFELKETNGREDLGRYLEEFELAVEAQSYSAATGEIAYDWVMNYQAPKLTTYASDIEYKATSAGLVFSDATTMGFGSVNGTVCENDGITFHCKAHNLPEQLSDDVDF